MASVRPGVPPDPPLDGDQAAPGGGTDPASGLRHGSADGDRNTVHLVPHTHWDREWYEPFQTFRMRLVDLVDQLLEMMAADEELRFTLDGQVATVDDYLEVRPEARPRIEALVRAGRLAIGPWQILMDEFLVSGETIIRNLQTGWEGAQRLGGAMSIGYLPDMFGHIAQMPQVLRRAGIGDAVVWRGVPAAIDRHAFRWTAPDGSTVRAEYLPGGYGNAAYLLSAPGGMSRTMGRFLEETQPMFGDGPVLAMYGTDHAFPSLQLAAEVRAAASDEDDFAIRIDTLADAITALGAEDDGLPTQPAWQGELRSSARANMLVSVTSSRIDIKVAAGRAERALERYAEPLAALHADTWPERLLELAWRRVINNSAHDSICGCSHDEVASQVLVRYAEATQIANGVTERALRAITAKVPRRWHAVVSPTPTDRDSLIELEVTGTETWPAVALELADGRSVPTQVLKGEQPDVSRLKLTGRDIAGLFGRRLHGRELFGRSLDGLVTEELEGRSRLLLIMDDPEAPEDLDLTGLIADVVSRAEAAPDEVWEAIPVPVERRRVVARVPVPPLGWTSVRPVRAEGEVADDSAAGRVRVSERRLSNGLIEVDVADDGTFALRGGGSALSGVGRIVEGGEAGDSYNYAPPRHDRIVEAPSSVWMRVLEDGPIRGRIEIVQGYDWPDEVLSGGKARSEDSTPVTVISVLELHAGEPFVRVSVEFENRSRDHRVRWHVPLPARAQHSSAEGQFAVVERGLTPEAGHGEAALATAPARGFVHVAGVTILLENIVEYELVDGAELALTLLRSHGLISRNDNANREDPAGPEIPVPDAQLPGPCSMRFAAIPHSGSWSEAGVLEVLERYAHPFLTSEGQASKSVRPTSQTGLAVEGEGVVLTSLRRRDGWLEARVVAEHPRPARARLSGAFRDAREVDLLGRTGGDLPLERNGELVVELGPWEIRTLQVR